MALQNIQTVLSMALPLQRCEAALTDPDECFTHATFPVINPQIKHDSSRAIAVVALLRLTPLLNVNL